MGLHSPTPPPPQDPLLLAGGGRPSGMHMLCGGVGLSAILADAGRSKEWPLPCAGPAPMTS